jgi:hypothetical protein
MDCGADIDDLWSLAHWTASDVSEPAPRRSGVVQHELKPRNAMVSEAPEASTVGDYAPESVMKGSSGIRQVTRRQG